MKKQSETMEIDHVQSDTNLALIKEFFKYYEAEDLAGLRLVLSPDIEWIVPGHHPLAGVKKGINEVLAYIIELKKSKFHADVKIVASNSDYVIDCHRGWGSHNGRTIDMTWVLLYKIEDGKIIKIQTYPEDQYAMDDFFWSVYNLKPIPDRLETN